MIEFMGVAYDEFKPLAARTKGMTPVISPVCPSSTSGRVTVSEFSPVTIIYIHLFSVQLLEIQFCKML